MRRSVGGAMTTTVPLTILTIPFLLACGPGDAAMSGGAGGYSGETGDPMTTGDGDGDGELVGFAEVRCVEISDTITQCFGLPAGSTDAWVPVFSDCFLDSKVASGSTDVDVWGPESCAAGTAPSFMPQSRCLDDGFATVCFTGDGSWWAPVTPTCAGWPDLPADPWPEWICGEVGQIGAHPWSDVGCSAAGPEPCGGSLGADAMQIWPTCYLDSLPAAPVPACTSKGDSFAEVRCVEGIVDTCYGRQSSAADAWSIVIPTCKVEEMIALGIATEIDGWGPETCRPGQHPEGTFAEWRCLWIEDRQASACLAGDGDWWTQVYPDCDLPVGPEPAWPSWQCEGAAGPMGDHAWDNVGCHIDATNCIAADGQDKVLVWPTCYIDSLPPIAAPECTFAGEAWGPCPVDAATGEPTLCSGEDLACVPADFGEANICLPIGACPAELPTFATVFELGWGQACYPRCEVDSDCAAGMVCGSATSDGLPVCAWPR